MESVERFISQPGEDTPGAARSEQHPVEDLLKGLNCFMIFTYGHYESNFCCQFERALKLWLTFAVFFQEDVMVHEVFTEAWQELDGVS